MCVLFEAFTDQFWSIRFFKAKVLLHYWWRWGSLKITVILLTTWFLLRKNAGHYPHRLIHWILLTSRVSIIGLFAWCLGLLLLSLVFLLNWCQHLLILVLLNQHSVFLIYGFSFLAVRDIWCVSLVWVLILELKISPCQRELLPRRYTAFIRVVHLLEWDALLQTWVVHTLCVLGLLMR